MKMTLSKDLVNACVKFFLVIVYNQFFQNLLFLRRNFTLVAQAGVQWHDLTHRNLRLLGSRDSLGLSLPSSWDYRHVPSHLANFVFLVEMGFLHVDRAGLELLTSGDPPTLVSQSTGITGVIPLCSAGHTLFLYSSSFIFPSRVL